VGGRPALSVHLRFEAVVLSVKGMLRELGVAVAFACARISVRIRRRHPVPIYAGTNMWIRRHADIP
jgi:hypothetical protein